MGIRRKPVKITERYAGDNALREWRTNMEILFSAEQISERVKQIAGEITRDYEGKPVTFICMLKGATIFFSDLIRAVDLDVEIEFLKASSYGDNSAPDGVVSIDYPLDLDIAGRHVILVEDIVDMGFTAAKLMEMLQKKQPASLRLCAFLDKPERRKMDDVEIHYLGYTIPNEFVVGYGLDYGQKHRNLPYLGVLKGDDV